MSTLPTAPSLAGKKVFLRPASPDDAANSHLWRTQSEPQSQTVHPLPFMTISEAVERFKKRETSIDHEIFAIVTVRDKTPVGKISFFNYNSLNRSAEMGIIVDPEERQKGYASEAVKLLVTYLFRYRNLQKVYCTTAAFNKSAIKLVESLDFQKDGVMFHFEI